MTFTFTATSLDPTLNELMRTLPRDRHLNPDNEAHARITDIFQAATALFGITDLDARRIIPYSPNDLAPYLLGEIATVRRVLRSRWPVPAEAPSPLITRCIRDLNTPLHPTPPKPIPPSSQIQKALDHAHNLKEHLQGASKSDEFLRNELHFLNEALEFPSFLIPIAHYPRSLKLHQIDKLIRHLTDQKQCALTHELLIPFKEHTLTTHKGTSDPFINYHILKPLLDDPTASKSLAVRLDQIALEEYHRPFSLSRVSEARTSEVKEHLHVLLVSIEYKDIYTNGGLGTYTKEYAETLIAKGHKVTVLMPDFAKRTTAAKVDDFVLNHTILGKGYSTDIKTEEIGGIRYDYIQDTGEYELYDLKGGNPYDDNNKDYRFLHFQSAVASYIEAKKTEIDIVHCNDWHTGFVPEFLAQRYPTADLPPTLFMIHNAGEASQGRQYRKIPVEGLSSTRSMESALTFATEVATVSPHHAKELKGGAAGSLSGAMSARNLTGIMNGIKMEHPEGNLTDIKEAARARLRTAFPLIDFGDKEIVLYFGRYDSSQKGIHRLEAAMDAAHAAGAVFICMGRGEDTTASSILDRMESKGLSNVLIIRDDRDPRIQVAHGLDIKKAATIGLYPSDYEPCGLTNIELAQYGISGVYNPVGGLVDFFDKMPGTSKATPWDGWDFGKAVRYAIETHHALSAEAKEAQYQGVRQAAYDHFRWEARATEYDHLYRRMLGQVAGGGGVGAAAGAGAGAGGA